MIVLIYNDLDYIFMIFDFCFFLVGKGIKM